jgi:hypothetical protein
VLHIPTTLGVVMVSQVFAYGHNHWMVYLLYMLTFAYQLYLCKANLCVAHMKGSNTIGPNNLANISTVICLYN